MNVHFSPPKNTIEDAADWREGLTDTKEDAADWRNKNVEAIMTSTRIWEM